MAAKAALQNLLEGISLENSFNELIGFIDKSPYSSLILNFSYIFTVNVFSQP